MIYKIICILFFKVCIKVATLSLDRYILKISGLGIDRWNIKRPKKDPIYRRIKNEN